MEIRVSLTDFRAYLSELVGKVEIGGKKVVIERFGVPTEALRTLRRFQKLFR